MRERRADPVKPVVSQSEIETSLARSGKKPEADSSSQEEDEEDGSKSDGPDVNVQPVATKTVKSRPVKSASKPEAELSAPSKPVSLKRAPGKVKESQAKKRKQLFQRIWSEVDEIVILKGMLEYAAKKQADPVADLNPFHEFIKKNIHIDVSRRNCRTFGIRDEKRNVPTNGSTYMVFICYRGYTHAEKRNVQPNGSSDMVFIGTVAILMQEVIVVYPFLAPPPEITPEMAVRACNALVLFQKRGMYVLQNGSSDMVFIWYGCYINAVIAPYPFVPPPPKINPKIAVRACSSVPFSIANKETSNVPPPRLKT